MEEVRAVRQRCDCDQLACCMCGVGWDGLKRATMRGGRQRGTNLPLGTGDCGLHGVGWESGVASPLIAVVVNVDE